MKPFANEPILELRRAPVRAQLAGALAAFDEEPVVQVPVWVIACFSRSRASEEK